MNKELKYLMSHRNNFTFSGDELNVTISYDKNGMDFIKGFKLFDEKGQRVIETKHPESLRRAIKTKASLNFQIKQWAESRADGTLPLILFSKRIANEKYPHLNINEQDNPPDIETELSLPEWVVNAVEKQKNKYYK